MKNNLLKRFFLNILQKLSAEVLDLYNPKVILISGTIGKTTTKDVTAEVFKKHFSLIKTADNSNNEFGVVYTILGLNPLEGWVKKLLRLCLIAIGCFFKIRLKYPEVLILEVGTRKVGDIETATHFIKADVVVITKISKIPSHIEFFKNLNELANEELSTINCLKSDGKIVCFEDDNKYLTQDIRNKYTVLNVSNNANTKSNRLINWNYVYDQKNRVTGCSFVLNISKKNYKIICKGCASKSYAYSLLYAYSTLQEFVITEPFISNISEITNGRSKILNGMRGCTIIDDSYNASPESVIQALDDFDKIICKGKKIAVIGEMLELGNYSYDAHVEVIRKAESVVDEIFLIGKAFQKYNSNKIKGIFCNSREIGDYLYKSLLQNDIVLLKGSQNNRLEIAVQLISEKEKDITLDLVRQTPFWRNKFSIIFSTNNVPFYDQNIISDWKINGFLSYKEAQYWDKKTCGISCIKMVVEAFDRKAISTGELIKEAVSNNSYKVDIGWIHSKIAFLISQKFLLFAVSKRKVSVKYIKNVLDKGGLVIASVGFGFQHKKAGHLVVLLGYELKDRVVSGFYVHHPSTKKESCLVRSFVSIEKFISSFSGNIIKIKNKK